MSFSSWPWLTTKYWDDSDSKRSTSDLLTRREMFNIFCSVSALVLSLLCRRLNEMAHTTKGDYFCLGAHRATKNGTEGCVWKKAKAPFGISTLKFWALIFVLFGVMGFRGNAPNLSYWAFISFAETEHDDDKHRRRYHAHFIEGLQSAGGRRIVLVVMHALWDPTGEVNDARTRPRSAPSSRRRGQGSSNSTGDLDRRKGTKVPGVDSSRQQLWPSGSSPRLTSKISSSPASGRSRSTRMQWEQEQQQRRRVKFREGGPFGTGTATTAARSSRKRSRSQQHNNINHSATGQTAAAAAAAVFPAPSRIDDCNVARQSIKGSRGAESLRKNFTRGSATPRVR